MPFALYREWLEFHTQIHPLDPAYVIMRGLSGGEKKQAVAGGGWRALEINAMNLIRRQESGAIGY